MGQRGPAPKPTALRIAEGNPSSRPLPSNEPKPPKGMPTCPKHLSLEAKAEWKRLCKTLSDMGLLTKVDRAAMAAYCQLYGRWVKLENELKESKRPSVTITDKGYPVANPLLGMINTTLTQMKSYMTEFGLTPSSRTRLITFPDSDDGKTAEEQRAARLLGA